ncbi:hypothetical protein L6172_09190 [Thalassospiraceae bacterium SW-3-3]|nr:hypothetical protein L6172_09190 [Thalassospiraceae bacterium SW-3-3]
MNILLAAALTGAIIVFVKAITHGYCRFETLETFEVDFVNDRRRDQPVHRMCVSAIAPAIFWNGFYRNRHTDAGSGIKAYQTVHSIPAMAILPA